MNQLRTRLLELIRASYFFAVTASVWLLMAGTALARREEVESTAPGEKNYGLQYALVAMCVALGIIVVCRADKRGNESKLKRQNDED